jgi:large subunit ribosomal protein L3
MKAIVGRKLGMGQIVSDNGSVVPVTFISAGPCTVTQVKTLEKDGYKAIQVGLDGGKRVGKSLAGHAKKSGIMPAKLKEFRIDFDEEATQVGSSFDVSEFEVGDKVKVTGTSKGKGFAGGIKRHNFHRQFKTHGGKGDTRKLGSIGSMYPQKIFKGKKMPGHMGAEQVSVLNLKVAYVDKDAGIIGIRGAVPGPRKSYVTVQAQSQGGEK